MHVAFRCFCLVVLSGLAGATSSWAQQTGTLAGVVRDAQGAVLPGVTVTATSDALLGARTSPTGATGTYLLTGLPPGTYVVTYELIGFTPLKRENVIILVAQTTRLDAELGLGLLQETVTVGGASPMVDVSSTVTQTNITEDIYETIPTGRNMGDGRARAERRDRAPRCGRHGRNAAMQRSRRSARRIIRSRSPSTVSRRTGAAAAAPRCSATASRCATNTTCRRRRAPRKAT